MYRPWDNWETLELGTQDTLGYRKLFINSEGTEVSLWNDVPLFLDARTLHSVCKSPKGTCSAYHVEITEDTPALKLALNKGKICSYAYPSPWNIGMLPQTWADPSQLNADKFQGLLNDGQPIEVIEISRCPASTGKVSVVKPLTAFLVMNTVHITLHIIAINVEDPISENLNSRSDIEKHIPGTIDSVREWLQNCYGLEDKRTVLSGEVKSEFPIEEIFSLIHKAHASWKLFSEVQCEWKQRSAEVLNYGMIMWENYIVHDSTARIPRTKKSLDSNRLYAMAWASSKENEENERHEPSHKEPRTKSFGRQRSRRGDLVSCMFKEPKNLKTPPTTKKSVEKPKKSDFQQSQSCFCIPFAVFRIFKS